MSPRSRAAIAVDEAAERLVRQRRTWMYVLLGALVVIESMLSWYAPPSWVYVVVGIAWLGIVVQDSLVHLQHELIEVNDQLAGRKDELRSLLEDTQPKQEDE